MGLFKAQFLIIAKVQRRKLQITGRHLKKIIVTLQLYTLLLFFLFSQSTGRLFIVYLFLLYVKVTLKTGCALTLTFLRAVLKPVTTTTSSGFRVLVLFTDCRHAVYSFVM